MRTAGKIHAATLVALVAASACHDTNAPQIVAPRRLEVIGSASQYAVRGDDASSPFRVRVIGSDGRPFAGVPVRWGTQPGAALVDPALSTTDPVGEASARANELAVTGPIDVTASVDNLAPVTFTIYTADPCLNVNAHATRVDSVVSGVLRSIDCAIDDRYYDFYVFPLAAQRAVTFDAKSQAFDPVVLGFDFNTGAGLGARGDATHSGEASMRMILPAGLNAVGVASYASVLTGPYTLTVQAAEEDESGCAEILIVHGIETHQQLDAGDCSNAPDPGWYDAYFIFLWEGQAVTFTESSAEFTPHLRISNASGTVVEESTGGEFEPATIGFYAPSSAYYLVAASSVGATSGAYTLSTVDGVTNTGPWLSRMTSGAGHQSWQPAPRFPR